MTKEEKIYLLNEIKEVYELDYKYFRYNYSQDIVLDHGDFYLKNVKDRDSCIVEPNHEKISFRINKTFYQLDFSRVSLNSTKIDLADIDFIQMPDYYINSN